MSDAPDGDTDPFVETRRLLSERAAMLARLRDIEDRYLALAVSALDGAEELRRETPTERALELIAKLDAIANQAEREEAAARAESDAYLEQTAAFELQVQYLGRANVVMNEILARIRSGELSDDDTSPVARALRKRVELLRAGSDANRPPGPAGADDPR